MIWSTLSSSLIANFIIITLAPTNAQDITPIFQNCHRSSKNFDPCILRAFNQLRKYFKDGLPEYGVLPFDPHRAKFVELRRGDASGLGGFSLKLLDVSEYGWAISNVTKYRTDREHDRIVYSQYFPEKSLDGNYQLDAKMLGSNINNKGMWNLTLYDYSQTTSVTRIGGVGGLLKIRVEIDRIGDMQLHIGNMFGGRIGIGNGFEMLFSIIDTD